MSDVIAVVGVAYVMGLIGSSLYLLWHVLEIGYVEMEWGDDE